MINSKQQQQQQEEEEEQKTQKEENKTSNKRDTTNNTKHKKNMKQKTANPVSVSRNINTFRVRFGNNKHILRQTKPQEAAAWHTP